MGKPKVLAVVGPTASGKTALGVFLAKAFGGEVVSADSMQIYKGLDIATAKPAEAEMQGVPHHLIDFVLPTEKYSVASFCRDAAKAFDDILGRKKLPVLVGGTGLYVDSFLSGTSFFDSARDENIRDTLREKLAEQGAKALYDELCKVDPASSKTIHPNDEFRILRALEVYYSTGRTISEQTSESHPASPPYDVLYFGLTFQDRKLLYERINTRCDRMIEMGLVNEAKDFFELHAPGTAVNAIGYKELKPYLDGEKGLADCTEAFKRATRRYAKRQLTWFRRNEKIFWLAADSFSDQNELFCRAAALTQDFLNGEPYEKKADN